ncbi:hypothetical protein Mgra_00001555 [Meloidogyne graminicola]|uniref:Uncharacterized protein n=1 Tax=Meloidogyne graminicola TaxID=189291 RepID=A0A8T0A144_9BILA|nr:hypothetical protein Mgra_00001555 [Meloidogyne graminicola]
MNASIIYITYKTKLVSCSTPDAVPSIIFQVVVYFNFISLICYLLLWAIMRKNGKSNLSANIYATRRILNSIISVFLLEFFGWFGNTLTRNILTWLQVSPIFLWRAMNIAGIILVPILALYAPVLYIMSKDYGRAFNNCFGFHFPFTSKHDNAGSSIINNKKGITIQQQIKVSKMDIIRPWTNLQTTEPSFVDTQRN